MNLNLRHQVSLLALGIGVALAGLGQSPVASAQNIDKAKKVAFEAVDRNASTIAEIGDAVYYYGEPGMQEVESTKLLKGTLEAAGFDVKTGGAGMPTNFWASWGEGGPVILIESEIDALPGGSQKPGDFKKNPLVDGAPGHAEGHNTHAALAAGAAYAVKEAMQKYKIPGTVVVNLGPAEEALASRPFMLRDGMLKGIDAAIIFHIGDQFVTGYGLGSFAAISYKYNFSGVSAHGAMMPWDGKNALDAVELMDTGMAFLRQQLEPPYRVHRVITNGGLQPNIIPDKTQVWYFFRADTMPRAKAIFDKANEVAEGAAKMTFTTVSKEYSASAYPSLQNKAIGETIHKNMLLVGAPKYTAEEEDFAKSFQKDSLHKPVIGLKKTVAPFGAKKQVAASNDSGGVSWVVPTGYLNFPAYVPGTIIHNWHAAVTPISSIAHKGEVAGAKVVAASVLDLLTDPKLRQAAKSEFTADTKDNPFKSMVPEGIKPDIDLNKATMEKYRPLMKKYYLNVTPRFK